MSSDPVIVEHPAEDVWILRMQSSPKGDGVFDNTFNPTFMNALMKALDFVEEKSQGNSACLITTSSGKIYSNGLDLNAMLDGGPDGQIQLMTLYHKLLHRLLTFPMPTVAAINGHAFAGGWLFALTHDYRVMNSDKGFACMTEVDLGFPLTMGMNALIKETLPRRLAAKMMLEGCRLDANQLLEDKAITQAVKQSEVLTTSIALGQKIAPKAKSGVYGRLRRDMYEAAVEALFNGPVLPSGL